MGRNKYLFNDLLMTKRLEDVEHNKDEVGSPGHSNNLRKKITNSGRGKSNCNKSESTVNEVKGGFERSSSNRRSALAQFMRD